MKCGGYPTKRPRLFALMVDGLRETPGARPTVSQRLLVGGQRELEGRAARFVRFRPQISAMSIDYGATDGESNSNTTRLCREERLKNAGTVLGANPRARIDYRN